MPGARVLGARTSGLGAPTHRAQSPEREARSSEPVSRPVGPPFLGVRSAPPRATPPLRGSSGVPSTLAPGHPAAGRPAIPLQASGSARRATTDGVAARRGGRGGHRPGDSGRADPVAPASTRPQPQPLWPSPAGPRGTNKKARRWRAFLRQRVRHRVRRLVRQRSTGAPTTPYCPATPRPRRPAFPQATRHQAMRSIPPM